MNSQLSKGGSLKGGSLIGRSVIVGSVLFLQSVVGIAAESGAINLEDVLSMPLDQLTATHVTTVSRQKEPYLTAPGTVYLLSREYMDAYGYDLLQDALQSVPSLNLYNPQSPLAGGQRGALSNLAQTKLLLNGHEVNNLVAQEAFLSRQFTSHNIERVEVMASPGSVLYGANALSGVINVITREAQADYEGLDIGLGIGSFNTKTLAATFGHFFGEDLRLSGSLHWFDSDEEDFDGFINSDEFQAGWVDKERVPTINYRNPSDAQTYSLQLDYKQLQLGYFDYTNVQGTGLNTLTWSYHDSEDNRRFQLFHGSYQHRFDDQLSLKAKVEYAKSRFWGRYYNAAWPNTGNQTDDSVSVQPFTDPGTGVTFAEHLNDMGTIDLDNLTTEDINTYFRRIYTNKATDGSKRKALDIQLDWQLNKQNQLILGLAGESVDYVGLATLNAGIGVGATFDIPIDSHKKKDVFDSENLAVFGQYRRELEAGKLWLHLGLRYDDHNHYGNNTSPRLSLVWRPMEQRVFKFIYGEAFSAPNVFDLSSDPDKEASTLTAYELNFSEFFNADNWLQLALYHNKITDFLGAPPALIGDAKAAVDSETVEGLEVHFEGRANNWNYHANGSWIIDTKQETNLGSQSILGLPETAINLGLSYYFDRRYQAGLTYFFSDSYRALHGSRDINDITDIPTSHTLNAVLNIRDMSLAGWDTKLSVKINNLTDRDNYQANIRRTGTDRFLQNGRSVMLNIDLEF